MISRIKYIHKSLEPILKETYGVILYQEQVMQIANVFAGYSFAEADILRIAMSKKKSELMESQRKPFMENAEKKHFDREFFKWFELTITEISSIGVISGQSPIVNGVSSLSFI